MNTTLNSKLCPLCGQSNQCTEADPASAGGNCWCFSTPIAPEALAQLREEQRNLSCLCPNCARGVAALNNPSVT